MMRFRVNLGLTLPNVPLGARTFFLCEAELPCLMQNAGRWWIGPQRSGWMHAVFVSRAAQDLRRVITIELLIGPSDAYIQKE
jgi:hypothetical protein